MDPRLAPLYEIFKLNSRLFLNCLEDMTEDQAQWRPTAHTNNATFIALHMVDSRHLAASLVGLHLENPFAALTHVHRIEEIRTFPRLDELRAAWKAVTGDLRERLKHLATADLDAPHGQRLPTEDPSVLGALAFLFQHDSYHLGMLALLRKQVGLPAMRY